MTDDFNNLSHSVCNGLVDPNDFYSIKIDGSGAKLQGYTTKKNKKKYKCSFLLKKSLTRIGWFEGKMCGISMTLTK